MNFLSFECLKHNLYVGQRLLIYVNRYPVCLIVIVNLRLKAMMERLLLHPRNCLIFHLSGRLFYNLAHSCSHPCSPRPSLPSRPVFHAASSSSSLALVSCRPVHSILSRIASLCLTYTYTRLSLLLAQPPRSLFARLPLSLSLSLCLLDAIPLLLSYFRALYMLVPILLPVPTSSACSPLVPQHAHVSRGCVGARAQSLTQWHTTDRHGNGVRMRSTYRVEGTDDSAAYTPQRSALMPCVLAR